MSTCPCFTCQASWRAKASIDWRARAEKAEAELAALQRSNEKRGVEVSSELDALEARAEAAEKRAVALLRYVGHFRSCPAAVEFRDHGIDYTCTCGLAALLGAGS